MTGVLAFSLFGSDTPQSGTGSLQFATRGAASASFEFYMPRRTCPAVGNGIGTVSGAVNGSFTFSVNGNVLTMTISGPGYHVTGGGAFVVHLIGNPCGAWNVTADVAAAVAG